MNADRLEHGRVIKRLVVAIDLRPTELEDTAPASLRWLALRI